MTGKIKYAVGPSGLGVASVRFAIGSDLAAARAIDPDALDLAAGEYTKTFQLPPGALWLGYRMETVADGYTNAPIQVVGGVDLSGLTYGGGGPLAGVSFSVQLDGGANHTIVFGTAGGAPANMNAVVTAINTQAGATIASLDGGHHLVITGTVIGEGASIVLQDAGALDVLGLPAGTGNTLLVGLLDINTAGIEPQLDIPQGAGAVYSSIVGGDENWLSLVGSSVTISANISGNLPLTWGSGHYVVTALFAVPTSL